jgi:hypothetical protein
MYWTQTRRKKLTDIQLPQDLYDEKRHGPPGPLRLIGGKECVVKTAVGQLVPYLA